MSNDRSRLSTTARQKTVELGIAILQELGREAGPRGVRDLARTMDSNKSTLHRILTTLEARQIVQFDPKTECYALGPGLLALVGAYTQRDALIRAASDPMLELFRKTGETVELSIIMDYQRMTIHQLESRQDLRYASGVGRLYPLHAGSTGRVLLSMLDRAALRDHLDHLGMEALTPNTITDKQKLLDQIDLARKNRYAASWEEGFSGVAGCSVPLRGGINPSAALGVYGPASRFTTSLVHDYVALLREATARIEATLGVDPVGRQRIREHVRRKHRRRDGDDQSESVA